MEFNAEKDSIAITIPGFRMRHTADLGKNEIFILTLAIDEGGESNPKPSLFVNKLIIPKVKKWNWVNLGGHGRIVYGPANPGSFVYYTIMFIEGDEDVRNIGNTIDQVFSSEEAKGIINLLSTVNPTTQLVTFVLSSLVTLVGKIMKTNKDDIIFTTEGSFFRDVEPPYNIGDSFNTLNHHIECIVKVFPLVKQENLSPAALFKRNLAFSEKSPILADTNGGSLMEAAEESEIVTSPSESSSELGIELLASIPKKVE